MTLGYIENSIDILKTSPIRRYLEGAKEKNIFERERKILNDIDEIIKVNKENLYKKLKVVVMGEVKAGKSTFVNYLVGRKVSHTNVLEATSTIIEVKYSEKDEVIIKRNNMNDIRLNNIEELDRMLETNKENKEFFDEIDLIIIGVKSEKLKKLTIVDTPGLNTITGKNEEITNEYIKNSDIILWVLNSNHFGQSDVNLKIEDVRKYGKDIIGIANRIDEIDGEYDEIIDYLNCEMGHVFSDIFAISAKKAYEGIIKDDENKLEDSKINILDEYLTNTIEKKPQSVKLEASLKSINIQIDIDIKTHKKAKENLSNILENLKKDYNELVKFNSNCKVEIDNKLDEWLNKKFLEKEREELIHSDMFKFNEMVKTKFNNDELLKKINIKYDELGRELYEKWSNNIEKINERNFAKKLEQNELDVVDNIEESNTNYESIIKGGVTGSGIALALAGYSAWLGPAAAYVSIGSAISAFLPPLLIAGAVGGVMWKVSGADRSYRCNQVDKIINNIKSNVQIEVLPKMKSNLYDISNNYMESSKKALESILTQCNTSMKEVEIILKEIEEYIETMEESVNLVNIEHENKNKYERNRIIN
ncbi:dynamin family protein [Clostridium baratii]